MMEVCSLHVWMMLEGILKLRFLTLLIISHPPLLLRLHTDRLPGWFSSVADLSVDELTAEFE